MTDDRALSRRALLLAGGAVTVSLAGCSGGSDTTPDTESNDTPNDTPEGNDTESGPGSDDSEDSPEVRVSATLRDPDGGALEAVHLGDRTANGTTQQRVAVDGTQIEVDGETNWLYAAIDIEPKLLLEVDVYSRRGTIPRQRSSTV